MSHSATEVSSNVLLRPDVDWNIAWNSPLPPFQRNHFWTPAASLPVPWLASFASSPQSPRAQINLLMLIHLSTDELDTCPAPSLSPLCIWHLLTEGCTSALKSQETQMTYDLLSEMIWSSSDMSSHTGVMLSHLDPYKCMSRPHSSWSKIKMLCSCKLIFMIWA